MTTVSNPKPFASQVAFTLPADHGRRSVVAIDGHENEYQFTGSFLTTNQKAGLRHRWFVVSKKQGEDGIHYTA
jgi:hypothetical protein